MLMKCKFCGADVRIGQRCAYCGSYAEPSYYGMAKPPKKDETQRIYLSHVTIRERQPRTTTSGGWYTVVKGDTLWDIAKDFFGSGAKYPAIVNANRDVITSPDRIYPGMQLKIPICHAQFGDTITADKFENW